MCLCCSLCCRPVVVFVEAVVGTVRVVCVCVVVCVVGTVVVFVDALVGTVRMVCVCVIVCVVGLL